MQTIGMTCHKKAYTGKTNLFHKGEKKDGLICAECKNRDRSPKIDKSGARKKVYE